jgi:subtilase family serine protease
VNGTIKLVVPLVATLAIAACNGGSAGIPGTSGATTLQSQSHRVPDWQAKGYVPACPQVVGKPTCLAILQSKSGVSPAVAGWAPVDFQTRYNLPSSTKGAGQIVAIVDAYDNPNVASDLAQYRSNFGLGTANFTKYNQNGQTSGYPSGNVGWGVEIDLDVEMVSAVCPKCTIYLIEANGADTADLEAAEVTAVNLGAHIVSNSWICYGSNSCVDPSKFAAPGVLYLAASGDAGYDNNGNPESLANVVSVGGTTLSKSGSTYNESAWNGAGGGCSNNGSGTGITKPSWQHDASCTYRTDSDVSAVALNVAEYDTYGYSGWFTVGGTSVASPLIGGVYALAGNASSQNAAQHIWKLKKKARKKELHDITSGSDGSCGGSYLCTGVKGYDGPTGWGTPNGIKAF